MQGSYRPEFRIIAASLAYPVVQAERKRLLEPIMGAVHPSRRQQADALYDREKDLLAIITETEL